MISELGNIFDSGYPNSFSVLDTYKQLECLPIGIIVKINRDKK